MSFPTMNTYLAVMITFTRFFHFTTQKGKRERGYRNTSHPKDRGEHRHIESGGGKGKDFTSGGRIARKRREKIHKLESMQGFEKAKWEKLQNAMST